MTKAKTARIVGNFGRGELDRIIRAMGREGFAFDGTEKIRGNLVAHFMRGRTCRHCGCSDNYACRGAMLTCHWASHDVCSSCS